MIKTLAQGFCDLLYPHNCIICQKYLKGHLKTDIFCPGCRSLWIANPPPFCVVCPRHCLKPGSCCSDCHRRPPFFDRAWSAFLYEGPLRRLLHEFKYGQKTFLRHEFGKALIDFVQTYALPIESHDYIIPIPLHSTRLRERGYNQAQLLAEMIGRRFELPLLSNRLLRRHFTRYQATVKPKERWTNLKGAFTISQPRELFGKSVLLVDDLLTTGATVSEAALLLKMAGARRVDVLTLAVA